MPIGYIITIVIIGVCTFTALIRATRLGILAFYVSVVINEIPHLAALFLVLSTALALVEGDLQGTGGTILLIIAAFELVGLLELTRRSIRAHAVVNTVAADHGATIGGGGVRLWLRPLVFPVPRRPGNVTRIGGLSYGEHPKQRLDVYRHRNSERTGPVLVYFHGGGYSSGTNRNEGRVLLHRLAAQGWTCISANYRLRPEAGFDDHLADARSVLQWAHSNAGIHGGDVSKIVMAGSSAGAHMTALTVLTPPKPLSPPPYSTSCSESADAEVVPPIAAAVCLYPWIGRYFGRSEDESQPSTPLALDPSNAPPMFIAHVHRPRRSRFLGSDRSGSRVPQACARRVIERDLVCRTARCPACLRRSAFLAQCLHRRRDRRVPASHRRSR
ncbi:alpha/beta hydrolase [Brevibacterium zhoupengii]|uniref:alpha/beta hydrolase n=1 Tax=Brevibacterium zhoupengii TaxID=2898795 RepID=UPI001E589FD4|nr:alpha/beta hydrolase [Brevibacterium zhoupengii]